MRGKFDLDDNLFIVERKESKVCCIDELVFGLCVELHKEPPNDWSMLDFYCLTVKKDFYHIIGEDLCGKWNAKVVIKKQKSKR